MDLIMTFHDEIEKKGLKNFRVNLHILYKP